MTRKGKKQQFLEDSALDWLMEWANAQDAEVPGHYFHICEGEAVTCGCSFEGEQ